MVFCAYCGKCFTRKEHLERHIPTHTNVKPHRCTACQLSFSRRDLLQRHYATYHEAKDNSSTVPGQVTIVAGRAPIACLNCANAKTGCDKRVPCARCADKNLPCAARFARRSSKMARKIGVPSESAISMSANNSMDLDGNSPPDPSRLYPSPHESSLDPRLQPSPPHQTCSPNASSLPTLMLPSPPNGMDAMDDLIHINPELVSPGSGFQDVLNWNGFALDLDLYPNADQSLPQQEMMIPLLDGDDVSSGLYSRNSSSRGSVSSTHTRSTSVASQGSDSPRLSGDIPEFDAVVQGDAAWPFARCNTLLFSGACPKTAMLHLESLERNCRDEEAWKSVERYLRMAEDDQTHILSVRSLSSRTRDKLLAITQTFVHRAMKVHNRDSSDFSRFGSTGPSFLVLPPSKILDHFLRTYHKSLLSYYLLTSGDTFDPNQMIDDDNQASALLLLLMIAQGASSVPSAEARYLAAGLIETCRLSLFDIIERDVGRCGDLTVLRCAVLFINLAAWSGDKWHMDIAMGQRGMYLAMMKHSGLLEPQLPSIAVLNPAVDSESQWKLWLQAEKRNRLVYNWVLMDQELSLFHDISPVLSITELRAPIPSYESLWRAKDASQWMGKLQENYGLDGNGSAFSLQAGPSLCDLFQDLLSDKITQQNPPQPLQLRLLLHPIQSLLYNLRQTISCFHDASNSQPTPGPAVQARLDEVHALLHKWYELCMVSAAADPNCSVTRANLTLYHLVNLDSVTSIPEIERLARKEGLDGSFWDLSRRYKHCIYQQQEALFHAGQVFRHVRGMPKEKRPQWWPAAIYRASMVFWMNSISHFDPNLPKPDPLGNPFAVDLTPADHPALVAYLWRGQGIPMLTRTDGGYASLSVPNDVLCLCVSLLDNGLPSRLSDGLKRKLQTLFARWHVEPLQSST